MNSSVNGGLHCDGWFSEVNDLWRGQAFSLKIKKVLYRERSKFQDVQVLESDTYGRVLVLDGVIQCTSRDEFAYQEMIAHIPLFSHLCPKSVLVVGGGDGGVLREVGKHPMVEDIHLCEIDEKVIEVSKKYFPSMAIGFANPKVKVHTLNGMDFLMQQKESFDVIITDSSDPVGPAEPLFGRAYFELVKGALKPGGIMCMQGECLWFTLDLIKNVLHECRELFPSTGYAYTTIPTYPCGQIGFVLASKNKDTVFEEPLRKISEGDAEVMNLRYYDSQVHSGSFILPRFAKKVLEANHCK